MLGSNRLLLWAALALAAIVSSLAVAGPVAANAIALTKAVCVAGADTAAAAFDLDLAALECEGPRFSRRDRFVRGRVELAKVPPLPPGPLMWQADPTSFDSMLIRLDYADGTQRLIDVDSQMAVRNWDANGNFWVPIQQPGAGLAAIDVVVERPQSGEVFRRMTLSSFADSSAHNYGRTLLYVLLCGMLLVPIIYDLFFFRVLRARFMLWHLEMAAGTLLYVLFNSGLILVLLPDLPSHLRYAMIFIAMSLAVLGTARFSLLILEEGMVSARTARLLMGAALVNLAVAALILPNWEMLRVRIVVAYLLSVLPVIAVTIAMLVSALAQGSRAARFLSFAYGGFILAGAAQVLASLGLFDMTGTTDEAIYISLVILVVGTSAGVGDRFLVIKSERDRARLTAIKLGAMANSDGLTGLLNRRAFDQNRRLRSGQALLVADIDRFKTVNDTYGHQRGDAVLRHVARVIESIVPAPPAGQVYRLGGEEFAVLCPAPDRAAMRRMGESIRAAVEGSADRPDVFDMPAITVSIGAVLGKGQLMHVAFADADQALYRAKEGGRNRCEIAADP